MCFKAAVEKKEVPVIETIAVTVEQQQSKLVQLEKKEPEPKLLSRVVGGMMNRSIYEYADGTKQTVTSPNQNYYATKQRNRDYMQYLSDTRSKFWITGMSFKEWLNFRDEVDEMAEQEEKERQQEFLNWYKPLKEIVYHEDNEVDNESYVDYNQELPNKEYTVTC
jgi:hypothetical protein